MRLISMQYAMTDAEVGAMVESLLACSADATHGIVLKDFSTDRVLAGDAHAIRPMLQPVQSGTQLVQFWIALERKECINLVKIQPPIDQIIAS